VDWEPIVAALIGALGGGVAGASLQGRRQDRVDRDQRRDRAAEVIAEVKALLTDLNPERLGFNAHEGTFDTSFTRLEERWQRLRVPLLTLWGGHPSKQVRDLSRDLEIAATNTLINGKWFVVDLLRGKDSEEAHENARLWHERETKLVNEVLEAIRKA
jgi:hypothetical protein